MNTAQLEPTRTKQANQPSTPSPTPSGAPVDSQPASSGGSHWWVFALVAVLVAALGFFVWHQLQSAKAAGANSKSKQAHDLPVMVAKARVGDLNQYLVGLGSVTPLNTVTVKSRVDGAITDILFKEGQRVKKDQPLINIDSRPYDDALLQAQGQLLKDQAAEASAEWSVEQDTVALKDKAIAQLQLHTDTATRDQARGAIKVDEANIAAAKLNITYSHITSPIDGVVGLQLVNLGNIVHAADTTGLVVITQLQPITVIFTVAEDDLDKVERRIASGQPIIVDAYDRNMTKKLATGKVLAVDNEIDPTTGTVKIKAIFDNTDNALYPSQFVNASMLVNTIKDAVLVPSAAIQHSPTSTFAYVVVPAKDKDAPSQPAADASGPTTKPARPPMMVTMRDVTIGATQAAVGSDSEDTTVVLSGLEPGDVVVTDGVDKLIEGTKVVPTFATVKARSTTQISTTQPSGPMSATTQPSHRTHKKPAAGE